MYIQLGNIKYYDFSANLDDIKGNFSKIPSSSKRFIINLPILKDLLTSKDYIDLLRNENKDKLWLKYSRLLNIYEDIPKSNKKFINRATFKALDILTKFNGLIVDQNFKSFHICEAPGGFIQAINHYITRVNRQINHEWSATTLKNIGKKKNVPEFIIPIDYNNSKGNYTYGLDGSGDLLKSDNIIYFWKNIDKADFISADGGFDVSDNYNLQEQKLHKLIFAQIITALGTQKINGCFLLKIFDITTKPTLQFLSLLTYFYEDIFIHKPINSRPCNSERYVYARKFLGCGKNILKKFIVLFKEWDNDSYIVDLNIKVPKEQFQPIRRFNNYFSSIQTKHIYAVLNVIQKPYLYKNFLEKNEKNKKNIVTYYNGFMFR